MSLLQTSTRGGRRSSTYHAFLEGETKADDGVKVAEFVGEHPASRV